jgi:hypothetical protein
MNRGPKSRDFVSSVGVMTIHRRYWQCRCSCEGAYAVDEVLGLTSRWSKVLQKQMCRLAADTSFAITSEHLKELLGVQIAPETVRTLVESHGKTMAQFQVVDAQTQQAFIQAAGEAEFAVDAGKVHTREEGWKDLKIAVISKRPLGTPATPAEWNTSRLPSTTIALSWAAIAQAKTFRRQWKSRLKLLGVKAFAELHALGDGAAWIWKSVERSLTGCVQTLDIYHGCEHLHRCAESIHGEGTPATATALDRGRELLLSQGWAGVCAWVAELLAVEEESEREQRRKATDKLIKYFAAHIHRLNYQKMLQQGRVIGSGAVEGQAKTLNLRLKRRGARWNRCNVQPMASLVCVRNSPQFDAYWAAAA